MAGYLGYFLQGMQSGIQTGTQLLEMKWKKDQKKKLEQKEAELTEAASIFNNAVSTAGEDGFYSDDEIMKIDAMYIALAYEVKGRVEGSYKAMQAMDKKVVEENNQWFDYLKEGLEGLNAKDVQSLVDFVRPHIKGEKGLLTLEALEIMEEKRRGIEAERPGVEVFPSAEALRVKYPKAGVKYTDEGYVPTFAEPTTEEPTVTFSEKRFNWKIEQYNQGRITLNQLLESEGIDMLPEKATGLEKQIQDIKTEGKRAGIESTKINKAIQDKILGKSEAKVTPEGEISAGEKRTFDMASSVMFGSSDWVTGISKPGIISMDISNKLNMGQKLTEEENAEVRNNYNAIKETLPSEIQSVIESQLKRYGIPLEAPVIEPEPLPPPKTKEWWEFWKKGETPEEKKDEYGYILGEIKEIEGKKWKYIGDDKWEQIF